MDEDRILAMSAFEAAYIIRVFRGRNPSLSSPELIATLRSIRADFYPHDYDAGMFLEELIPPEVNSQAEQFFVSAVNAIIGLKNPVWARLAPAGRNHVLQAVGVNGVQCLRAAGLLSADSHATDWWDALASENRSGRDASLLAQGRLGERMSLAYECSRLEREGIARSPVWIAIEDNTVGYDILSFTRHESREINRLIEVKTTRSNSLRMFLSRNEWETAERFGAAFEFHLWNLDAGTLNIFSVEEIREHIPRDNGSGRWESVLIYPASGRAI